jgi:hypothetical protein
MMSITWERIALVDVPLVPLRCNRNHISRRECVNIFRVMLTGVPGALVKELKEEIFASKRALYSLLRS